MLKSGVDIVGALEYIGTSEKILSYLRDSEAGYYALSYACYKIATPVRYTVTVAGTTVAITKLKDTGYLKSTSEFAGKFKEKIRELRLAALISCSICLVLLGLYWSRDNDWKHETDQITEKKD